MCCTYQITENNTQLQMLQVKTDPSLAWDLVKNMFKVCVLSNYFFLWMSFNFFIIIINH